MTVSVQVIGIMEFAKNFMRNAHGRRKLALCSLFVTVSCALLNSPLTPPWLTGLFNIVALSLAVTQLGYQVIMRAIPAVIEGIVNRTIGGKDG